MEKKRRSFSELKKSMSYESFNSFCKELTERYAKSEPQFARSYFCEKYNISYDCYYKVQEYAVVTALVEKSIVEKMINKAVRNQKANHKSAGSSTIIKYNRMYTDRCRYLAAMLQEKEILHIATDFADNPDISKRDFAAAYGLETKVLEMILERAIEENVVSDNTFEAIKRRSLKGNFSKAAEDYFIALKAKRIANKKGITLE